MKEINVKVYEYEIAKETYYIYVYKTEDNMTEFYVGKKGYGIIRFEVGYEIEKLNKTIEDFINENLVEWAYFYNEDIEE